MVLGSGNGKSKWIHSPESLLNGRVTYTVKFVGKAEVPEPRGMAMVKAALQKLSFSRQLKRSEGAKPPKVELGISVHSVSITDVKTKETLHSISLHRVSFCADDKEDKRLFAFIAKLDDNKHYCYGLDSLHQANDITLTIGQAFELAYQKFMKDNQLASNTKKVTDMSKRIQELESENNELRRRIAELEATQHNMHNGSRAGPTTTAQVSSTASLVQLHTETVAIPRRSSPTLAPVTTPQQEAIANPHAITSSSTRSSLPSSFSTVSKQLNNASSTEADVMSTCSTMAQGQLNSIYSDVYHENVKQNDFGQIRMGSEGSPSSVGNSVKKFRNSLQRNMRKTMASEDRMKKTLTSLFPAKIISKKLKKGRRDEPERKFTPLEDSPSSSCSSHRSSTYANLDDVIVTLQKMMDNGECHAKQNRKAQKTQPGSFIGEKLATHTDIAQHNYDTIPRRAPKLVALQSNDVRNSRAAHSNVHESTEPQVKPKPNTVIQTEGRNSTDDLSSLSTTTTDSSSRECVYVVQPTNPPPHDGKNAGVSNNAIHFSENRVMQSQPRPARYQRPLSPAKVAYSQGSSKRTPAASTQPWPGTNVDSTLRQLGGEEGYMLLTGRKQVEDILANAPPISAFNGMQQDEVIDSTYDNVSRLMEAVREAAARDAEKQGEDPRKILTTPASVATLITRGGRPIQKKVSHTSSALGNMQPVSTASSAAFAEHITHSASPEYLPMATTTRASYPDTSSNQAPFQQDFMKIRNFSSSIPFQPHNVSSSLQPHNVSSSHPMPFGRGIQMSQETDILFSQDQTMPPSARLRLTSEDAFNMQPFVPTSSLTRLPQPPSRKPVKSQGPWQDDPFNPIQNPKTIGSELVDMQSLSESSDTTPRSRKSNYHVISHPLIRKKHRPRKSGLKWSNKYFPNGKKKNNAPPKKGKFPTAADITALNSAFSRGLVVSDENLTLDSFDPLKH